jgi:cruciform cutting endonuclease 1
MHLALNRTKWKAWKLKYWAFLIGNPTSGTKEELQKSIAHTMNALPRHDGAQTIASVDMGIRNLAYCVVTTPTANSKSISVTDWKRMDLVSRSPADTPSAIEELDTIASRGHPPKLQPSTLDTSAFTPPILSQTAYSIVRTLLSHHPTTILIERQRFRSGGAAAIQEWTVRVNMLESMLWASLHTLRETLPDLTRKFPATHAISPQRVADFWLAQSDNNFPPHPIPPLFSESHQGPSPFTARSALPEPRAKGRRKTDKKDKISLVRSWITDPAAPVRLTFPPDSPAATMAAAFQTSSPPRARELAGGKLDDLADCLLQAVAQVRWEENRRRIRDALYPGFRTVGWAGDEGRP